MSQQQPDSPREMGRLMALSQIGFEMVVPIALGLWLDSALGWTPWGVVAGAVLGLGGGFAHLLLMLKRFEDRNSPERKDAS